ncbi:polysaccharide pyruvyl transferase family protein [Arenibaculum pallidiluteum]|uniref:polysaccharide pyruvyl transferase family protein n=1 Tax=Arenibaculum pallidiluteum TaxID=2812559 RepID=UPI001A96B689|nr:polysaccharide pyruvyl transferase family protein [Arenibaculum pallidiluteum]
MANILVMIPSGEVYDHDCVRWYRHTDIQRSIDHYHNIGDAFVYDSSLKLLAFDRLDVLEVREFRQEVVDRVNAEFDYVFLRGSNYIHAHMPWPEAIEQVLAKLKIPVIAFGVGAQAPATGKIQLSDESRRIWQVIADKSTTLGVRGTYTAEVLWDLGIKNTRIVGCPTAFRARDPELRIDLPDINSVRKVGITMRREVSKAYSPDVQTYLSVHRDFVKDMSRRFETVLMMQGEVEEKKLLWGTEEQKAEAWEALNGHDWLKQWFFDDEMRALYRERLWYSDVVAEWEALVRSKDLVLGYRLHGNLMALSNGVPSVYFSYDSRTKEFAETFQIPCYDVYSGRPFSLEEYWDQSLFERFNRTYYMRYRDMREFLDENYIPHRMPHPSARRPAERQVA